MDTKGRHGVIVLAVATLLLGTTGAATAQDRVSVYTAHKAEIVERLIPEFEKLTGIKADIVKAGSGDIINRARAESANPQADVIWSIGAELLEANSDLLEPYTPKEADLIDEAFRTDSAWIPYTGILTVLMVNTDELQPGEYPKTWADPDEFASLIEVIVTAFTDRLRELGDDPAEVPYP